MPEERVFPSDADDDDVDAEEKRNPDEKIKSFPQIQVHEDEKAPESIELKSSRKRALIEFRFRVEDSILSNRILEKNSKNGEKIIGSVVENEEITDLSLWGVPLLPSKGQDGTNIVLLKFLKARDFNVSEAFKLLKKTLKWRNEFEVEGICNENLGSDFKNMVFIDGEDRQGRPVCYNVFGAFKDRELYKAVFGTEEKREEFLRWKVQFIEKGMKRLKFKPNGVDSILQVIDLKNSPGPAMKELRSLNKKSMNLFCENYPELIFRTIFINVPVWYMLSHAIQLHFGTQGAKSKCNLVFARPGRVTQTLLKYIAPERLPVQYGGLKRENDDEFTPDDKASPLISRGLSVETIKIPLAEAGVTLIWDFTVVGFEVSYKEEFIPDDDCSYNVLLQGEKKMRESVRNSFYINEPGNIIITLDNGTTKNKKVFLRHKKRPTLPVYMLKSNV